MNTSVQKRLLPEGDRDSKPYWDGIRNHKLLVQTCSDCGLRRWPASPICRKCLGRKAAWEPVSGTGTIASWIVVRRPPNQAYDGAVPYAVVLVRLAEDPAMLVIGHVATPHVSAIKRGQKMRAVFLDVDDGTQLEWQPV